MALGFIKDSICLKSKGFSYFNKSTALLGSLISLCLSFLHMKEPFPVTIYCGPPKHYTQRIRFPKRKTVLSCLFMPVRHGEMAGFFPNIALKSSGYYHWGYLFHAFTPTLIFQGVGVSLSLAQRVNAPNIASKYITYFFFAMGEW